MMIDAVRDARDPWWVISGAAVALLGVTPIEVGDVDVLMSIGDAQRLMDALGVVPIGDGESSIFRSMLFGRWETPPFGSRDHGGVLCRDRGRVDGSATSNARAGLG
jgi:hypothetical protein